MAPTGEKVQHDCPCDWRCHVDGKPCCAACQQAELAVRAKADGESAGVPEWLTPGSEVVVIHGRNSIPSPVLTIAKVMKRDVVLSNGDRWSRTRLAQRGDHIQKPGNSVWDGYSALFPADHPKVTEAVREAARRSVAARCSTIVHKVGDAIRRGDWDEARRLNLHLGEWLANAPEPPLSARFTGVEE